MKRDKSSGRELYHETMSHLKEFFVEKGSKAKIRPPAKPEPLSKNQNSLEKYAPISKIGQMST